MKVATGFAAAAALAAPAYGLSFGSLFGDMSQLPFFGLKPVPAAPQSSILEQAADFFNEGANPALAQIWDELEAEFPDKVREVLTESQPIAASRRHDWLFTVKDEDRFPNHSLRIKSPSDLGVDSVQQYSGYLDLDEEDKHFFFWFFESRNDPENDPVVLWLNGGPGCSSMTGLFFELGPSSIDENLKPVYNPHAWNSNASVIFLDQPVNVGHSYSSNSVRSTVTAAKDVYALLELFFQQFPQYNGNGFHISGESYAGHYIPSFAREIVEQEDKSFNLTSILIGNGITNSLIQDESYEWMACGEGGHPAVISPEDCNSLHDKYPRCRALIEMCYNAPSALTCVPSSLYCGTLMEPYQKTGLNVYDIRVPCGDNPLCYDALGYVEQYLNLPEIKAAIGSEVEEFVGCDSQVGFGFMTTGDLSKPFHQDVAFLLEAEVPVLIYAGDKDYICNWLGNQAWVNALEWSGSEKFSVKPLSSWTVDGAPAGEVKNAGIFTFLRVFDAGHMVPYNQPENSLEMLNRWISGDFKYE